MVSFMQPVFMWPELIFQSASGHGCGCDEPLLCRRQSTSVSVPFTASMTTMTLMIIRDILLGHHVTRSRISVFNSDLQTIQQSLDLHAIPHTNMTLVQCRRALFTSSYHHRSLC
jgi:hypothetical protein